jgi:hypothetical protein
MIGYIKLDIELGKGTRIAEDPSSVVCRLSSAKQGETIDGLR